ncbi:prepilin-type N-terminal cleavage/methylation domain-containing protein [Antarctobacter sp.]|uniref:prepilin-type N-terminal cleavage/methylation domain-containing protein n=1 Tax=Antarctobacter sp. TaxID=1872577 RepID=UPI003A8FEE5A
MRRPVIGPVTRAPNPPNALNAPRNCRGLTLLELVIAIAILSLGTLATLNVIGQARTTLGGATPRLLAQLAAENRAEELRLPASGSLPATVTLGPYSFDIETRQRTTAAGLIRADITVTSQGGPGATLVTVLPPARVP